VEEYRKVSENHLVLWKVIALTERYVYEITANREKI